MDNLCHTLAGAALAETGLKRRTALAYATLLVGANLPDVDVVCVPFSVTGGLGCRRGWTHGVLAMALLPLALAGAMLLWDRLQRKWRRRSPGDVVRPRQLVLVAAIAILSHPLLDWTNVYGVRLLMPFSDRWFYGDTLFIIDPWLWLALGGAVLWARWRGRAAGAAAGDRGGRAGAVFAAAYVALMLGSAVAARRLVSREVASAAIEAMPGIMVGPVPVSPLRRDIVVDAGDHYRVGMFRWFARPSVTFEPAAIPKGADGELARTAAWTPEGRQFVRWARFPFFEVDSGAAGIAVHIGDLRYTADPRRSWAAVTVRLVGEPGAPGGP